MKTIAVLLLTFISSTSFAQYSAVRSGAGTGHIHEDLHEKFAQKSRALSIQSHPTYDELGIELLSLGVDLYEEISNYKTPAAQVIAEKIKTGLTNVFYVYGVFREESDLVVDTQDISDRMSNKKDSFSLSINKAQWKKLSPHQQKLITIHALLREAPQNYKITQEAAMYIQ